MKPLASAEAILPAPKKPMVSLADMPGVVTGQRKERKLKGWNALSQHYLAAILSALKRLLAELKDARERHKQRHRPTGFEFAVVDRIEFLNADDWDVATSGSGFFLGRSYLALLEKCCVEG